MAIGIVTDSGACLPKEVSDALGIRVLPAYVNVGGKSYQDSVEIRSEEIEDLARAAGAPASTAVPSPLDFTKLYNNLAGQGVSEILSIHIGDGLSGMYNSALLGARSIPSLRIHVYNSQQLGPGQGFMAVIAAEMARVGSRMEEILEALDARVNRTYGFIGTFTLESPRRSGRINFAQYGIGTLLGIKPILRLYQNKLDVPFKARTLTQLEDRLLEIGTGLAPFERLATFHYLAPEPLAAWKSRIGPLVERSDSLMECELTPTVGVNAGPSIGFSCITKAG